jgi:protein FAM50
VEQSKAELEQMEKLTAKQARADKKAKKKRLLAKKKMLSTLSFATEEDDLLLGPDDYDNDDDEQCNDKNVASAKPKKLSKDPTVDTSFLPDKHREEEELQLRTRLALEWKERQEAMKQEKLEIVYSYWDGSGHRRTVECKKGDTIGEFLERVRQDLSLEFRELSAIAADALVYVKEDLMIPQDLTFYDLIVTKARGKSGPLFHFDVHDDIRIGAIDSRVEKDESHPGKVVERRWYDRNKHIFPASRWEVFDPTKTYGSYTIHGREVHKK